MKRNQSPGFETPQEYVWYRSIIKSYPLEVKDILLEVSQESLGSFVSKAFRKSLVFRLEVRTIRRIQEHTPHRSEEDIGTLSG
jgi:hypothetical protein